MSLERYRSPLLLAAQGLRCLSWPFVPIDIKAIETELGIEESPGFRFSVDQNVHKEEEKC